MAGSSADAQKSAPAGKRVGQSLYRRIAVSAAAPEGQI